MGAKTGETSGDRQEVTSPVDLTDGTMLSALGNAHRELQKTKRPTTCRVALYISTLFGGLRQET